MGKRGARPPHQQHVGVIGSESARSEEISARGFEFRTFHFNQDCGRTEGLFLMVKIC